MYHSADCTDNTCCKPVNGDAQFHELVRRLTDLPDSDIAILAEVSHTLPYVSDLENGDVYIDILSRSSRLAVVVAQYSPPEGNFYNRSLVGDIMWRYNEPGVYRTLELGVPSRELKAVVNGNIIVKQNVSAIKNADNQILGALIVERNLQNPDLTSNLTNMEQVAPDSTVYGGREMQNIAEYMNDAMIRFNVQGVSVYANPQAKHLFKGLGYQDEIVGMPFENLAFGDYTFGDIVQRKQIEHSGIKIGKYILNVTYATILDEDHPLGAVLIIRDTTAEKTKEQELILKSAAIDEIHHRVKNNLQMIVSLIRLQARRSNSVEVKRFSLDINSRIYSISLIHEILTQKGVDDIDLKDMLNRMLKSSKNYIVPDDFDLDMEISGDNICINSGTATTIAVVVNELIQNCIKHAFVDRTHGKILLCISKGYLYSNITVSDNGIGFAKNSVDSSSLGHKLVKSLVKDKLKGKITFNSTAAGTQVYFDFVCSEDYYS